MPDPATELITATSLREMFAIDVGVVDPQLARAIKSGSRRLRVWVGDTAYDDALAVTPTNGTRADELAYAEAHLAMHFAILGLNTPLRQEGIVSGEKVEGAAVISYRSPDDTAKYQRMYLDAAEEVARPYMLADGTPASPFDVTNL